MRLAAIFIEEHEYLINEPQTINFGGQYFYEFKKRGNDVIVQRTSNDKFIPDFFNLTKLDSKVTNLAAIVGQNGAGKSTILDIIRSVFIDHKYALPQSNSLILLENDDQLQVPLILRNDFGNVFLRDGITKELIEIKFIDKVEVQLQTIYYSPHYDYKHNPNFDNLDNHDISFDRIVEEDLKDLNNKATNEYGWPYSTTQELLFKNSMRQITFLSSDLMQKEIFKDIYELQGHYEPILHFRGYKEIEFTENWNTPNKFRDILKTIEEKIKKEVDEFKKNRKNKKINDLNQIENNKFFLKINVLHSVISLLKNLMERKNSYLLEGSFPYEELEDRIKYVSASEALLLFIDHSTIQLGSSEPLNIFKDCNLGILLEKIYQAINKADNKNSVTLTTLLTTTEDAIEILRYQRQFLNELNSYYVKFYPNKNELVVDDSEKVAEFVNYMPFSRRMSSGEGALLNFFSRIYDFLNSNLKELKFRSLSSHYILLLDEADLGFHITWKKKYVKAILSTLPYFFDELENKPSIEIIFTTHDPITLSDMPNNNVIYLERPDYSSSTRVLDVNHVRRPLNSFGANISELIADSFFMKESLIGDFASEKIKEAVKWLNEENNLERKEYFKSLISLIDEPIVQRKLAEMYDAKTNVNFHADIIDQQINRLQELRNKLG